MTATHRAHVCVRDCALAAQRPTTSSRDMRAAGRSTARTCTQLLRGGGWPMASMCAAVRAMVAPRGRAGAYILSHAGRAITACWPSTRTDCAIPEQQRATVRRSRSAMIIAAAHIEARWLADYCAPFCALMRDMHGGGGRRPATISGRLLQRLNFISRLCSGLSRAAHEVFGPIFDIGPNLVDFEILRFLGPKLFMAQYDAIKIAKYDFNCKI
ncbi:hypothetical protein F511_09849 [Dorcoceras hygrometricum]|uniref:Uncharacterized protein n=1 Tax=Dorcoceras hygrometricum TaxID=472368 RepID=A0A2Z7CJ58_9LAMI|nr:hypothetical protein F511_09849 [Dorcoceras hygrometricum]